MSEDSEGVIAILAGLGPIQFSVLCFSGVAVIGIFAWLIKQLAPQISLGRLVDLFEFFLKELAGKKGPAGLVNGFVTLGFMIFTLLVLIFSFDFASLVVRDSSSNKAVGSNAFPYAILTAVVFVASFIILKLFEKENDVLSGSREALDAHEDVESQDAQDFPS